MNMHRFTIAVLACAAGVFSSVLTSSGQAPASDAKRPAIQAAPATYQELERLYLDGKISAKQYQKYANEIKSRPAPPPSVAVQPAPLPATAQPSQSLPPRPPVNPPTATAPPSKNDQVNAVEAKMDELIKAKAARDKAATNTPPPVATGPKSKRDRLNDLLRLYIEGKITEQEMNERRAKIISEP
jgi:hypothetical protein